MFLFYLGLSLLTIGRKHVYETIHNILSFHLIRIYRKYHYLSIELTSKSHVGSSITPSLLLKFKTFYLVNNVRDPHIIIRRPSKIADIVRQILDNTCWNQATLKNIPF